MTRLTKTATALLPQSSVDALCENLMDVMHAISQPLTVLRASLGGSEIGGQPEDELRRLLKQSSKEVERLCVLFQCLQQFVVVAGVKPELESTDLVDIVGHTVEGVDLLFSEAGVSLNYTPNLRANRTVVLDGSRFEQALSSVLLTALGRTARGGEVVVRMGTRDGLLETIGDRDHVVGGALSAETRLTMALAIANLRSQGASMTWKEAPFSAEIKLPCAATSNALAHGRAS